jgi:hypothetical protein
MRYELRKQIWSAPYPYDTGYAVWDTVENRQTGWYLNKAQATIGVAERNGSDDQAGTKSVFEVAE